MDEIEKREPVTPAAIWQDRELAPDGRVIEVHHHYHAPDPAPERKPNAADRFTPYFVIMSYLIIGTGSLAVISMMIAPSFMAMILALSASLVSITISAVSALIVIAVIAWIVRGMINDSREHDPDD